jgi:AraC-like DNA-binding protein
MLAGQLDTTPEAATPHHALLRQIHAYIDANLGSVELNPQQIAAAHFISTRHMHAIFREQGITVSSWVRSRRLEVCRRQLTDPLYFGRPVAFIAAQSGLIDPAHFSRVFKATFGESPTELRARTRSSLLES